MKCEGCTPTPYAPYNETPKPMRYLSLLFLLLLLPTQAPAQQLTDIKSFRHLGGPQPERWERIIKGISGRGMYVYIETAEVDTVLAWIQHATPNERPDYESADLADVVIWCHPQKWPHENHVLPDATGDLAVYVREGLLFVADKSALESSRR